MRRRENFRRGESCRIAIRSRWSSRLASFWTSHVACTSRMRVDRKPHIGEYDTKTNGFCALSQNRPASGAGRKSRLWARCQRLRRRLLPVAYQDLIAGMGQLGTIVLQAGQHGKVVLIHHGATVFLNIAGAGLLFLRCAGALLRWSWFGQGPGGSRQRQQSYYKQKTTHRVPLF
jgi:hypothetical protein